MGEVVAQGAYIVADFGKTYAKLTLWSKEGACLAKEVRANAVPPGDPYVPLDVIGISDWLTTSLGKFAQEPVEAIIPVAHGAAVAGIKGDELTFLPMDYEWEIPAEIVSAYQAERPTFAFSGSPALPAGLNMGTQLYYLDSLGLLKGVTLMPYAQYWAWWLSGKAVSEVSSLGCHSDLWYPGGNKFIFHGLTSDWAEQFAEIVGAGDCVGTLKPELAKAAGLSQNIRVYAGLHDSNAALVAARGFPEIADHQATVLSTGTWFVAMRSGAFPIINGHPVPARETLEDGTVVLLPYPDLPEDRDCLMNVDVNRNSVPSARFMGGREIELLGARIDLPEDQQAMIDALPGVLASGSMILPGFAPGCGPFPDSKGEWIRKPAKANEQRAAIALYAALVTDTALSLIGARECLLIEGRFAACNLFVRALASLRQNTKVYIATEEADVSLGAVRLIDPAIRPATQLAPVAPLREDLSSYAAIWRTRGRRV